jgi:enamine deaminase RidA (YjgF/YER057c/UK114 family)
MTRQQVSSGTIWERDYGYCRAIRVGNWVAVAGTTASDENSQVVSIGDAGGQATYILRKIERALQQVGASAKDVIRTHMFVVQGQDWEAVAKAHGEFFRDIRPVSTLVMVSALINPDMLVEIEVDAIVGDA